MGDGGVPRFAFGVWLAVVGLQVGVYVAFATFLPSLIPETRFYFGFNQYRHLHLPVTALVVIAALAAAFVPLKLPRPGRWIDGVAACLAGLAFFSLRSHFLNPDSKDLVWKFARDVPTLGAHVTHDEVWELWVHSRFWAATQRAFGWDVIFSYQVLSCLGGVVFVALLLLLARRMAPGHVLPFVALVLSGGYVQLFFGDPENYTLTAVWILAFWVAVHAHLTRERNLVWPSALLATAMGFHLLAGFLGPALAYLHIRAWVRGRWRQSLLGCLAFTAILGGTFVFFHFNGLPLERLLTDSHALGQGGRFASQFVEPSVRYYKGIGNLAFLLMPILWLVLPLALLDRRPWQPIDTALALGSVTMLLYMVVWRAQLGVLSDWNLFANVAIPVSLLLARRAVGLLQEERARGETLRFARAGVTALVVLWGTHSLAWVVQNHFHAI